MSKRILVIEDNPMVVKSLEFKLKKDGYTVVLAEDGRVAMQLLKDQEFDLVFFAVVCCAGCPLD